MSRFFVLGNEEKKRRETFRNLSFRMDRVRFNLRSSAICQSASGSENNAEQFLSGNDVYRLYFYKFGFSQGHYMRTYNLFFITKSHFE